MAHTRTYYKNDPLPAVTPNLPYSPMIAKTPGTVPLQQKAIVGSVLVPLVTFASIMTDLPTLTLYR